MFLYLVLAFAAGGLTAARILYRKLDAIALEMEAGMERVAVLERELALRENALDWQIRINAQTSEELVRRHGAAYSAAYFGQGAGRDDAATVAEHRRIIKVADNHYRFERFQAADDDVVAKRVEYVKQLNG